MKIETLSLRNFRSYRHLDLDFRAPNGRIRDFTCLYGPNGIGKTTVLEAVTLLCSSFDFVEAGPAAQDPMLAKIAQDRMENYLKKYIRNIDEDVPGETMLVAATFVHEDKRFRVELTEKGFAVNELLQQPFWWPGITYYAKFDTEMTNFQLQEHLWPDFKKAFEDITGFSVEPQIEMTRMGSYAIGFWLMKPDGKVHCRKASAGEKKLTRTLSSIINMETERRPHIVLVDEIEGHVYYKRHLKMVEVVKGLFESMQLIATTHSLPVIESYEPREHLLDIENVKYTTKETDNVQQSGDRPQDGGAGAGEVPGPEKV